MLNLNELNSIANNITNIEIEMDEKSIEPILEYCVKRHNESVKMIDEVRKFLEKTFPQFVSVANVKDAWVQSHTYRASSAKTNPYNCIRCWPCDEKEMYYWVDETIGFRMDKDGNISHIGLMPKVKPSEYLTNNYYDLKECGLSQSDLWNMKTEIVKKTTKLTIEKFKNEVDLAYVNSKRVVELLAVFLKKISYSVMERRDKINTMLDESVNAKKETIKIEIVRED